MLVVQKWCSGGVSVIVAQLKAGKMRYEVEIDFTGVYKTEVEADTPAEAYEEALEQLSSGIHEGTVSFSRSTSFQIFDEAMRPCDLKDLPQ